MYKKNVFVLDVVLFCFILTACSSKYVIQKNDNHSVSNTEKTYPNWETATPRSAKVIPVEDYEVYLTEMNKLDKIVRGGEVIIDFNEDESDKSFLSLSVKNNDIKIWYDSDTGSNYPQKISVNGKEIIYNISPVSLKQGFSFTYDSLEYMGKKYKFIENYGAISGIADEYGNEIVKYTYNETYSKRETYRNENGEWVLDTSDDFIGNVNLLTQFSMIYCFDTGFRIEYNYLVDVAHGRREITASQLLNLIK